MQIKLHTIQAGWFKLDGGAMFGVVPKTLWQRLNPPDENNLCTWALRCLLIETPQRRILVDTGIGTKQDDKFRSFFHPHGTIDIEQALQTEGFSADDITDVWITHLHFDHVGGAVKRVGEELVPTFPNARYWVDEEHWKWAVEPNERERASFLRENFMPLQEHGVLHFMPRSLSGWTPLDDQIRVVRCYGHTHGMMLPYIVTDSYRLLFGADLLPSQFHVRMPYVMSYDVRPLTTLKEKAALFHEAIEKDVIIFLEHDPKDACIRIHRDERGRFAVKEAGTLNDFIP